MERFCIGKSNEKSRSICIKGVRRGDVEGIMRGREKGRE